VHRRRLEPAHGRRRGLGDDHDADLRLRRRWRGQGHARHRLTRPGVKRRAVRAELDPDLFVAALDLIVLQHVEIDDDTNRVGPELRVPDVLDPAAVAAVVQGGASHQARAHEIDDEAGGVVEGEVLDVHRALNIDDDRHFAGSREHADGPHFAVSPTA
jgi:hypothetical protein